MSFEEIPQGAASLAQVHKAVLADGNTVAVKVQHPKVQAQSSKDIMVMEVSAARGQRESSASADYFTLSVTVTCVYTPPERQDLLTTHYYLSDGPDHSPVAFILRFLLKIAVLSTDTPFHLS